MQRPEVRPVSEAERRMRQVENAMLSHINGLSSPLGAPVAVYSDMPAVAAKEGKLAGPPRREPFICPALGLLLTHVVNLSKVCVEVHHRDDNSRYTDFALVFQPLHLVSLDPNGGPPRPYSGGPYTVRVEFKTSDTSVMSDVRVAGAGGQVDTRAIPDPEGEREAVDESDKELVQPSTSLGGRMGGLLRGAASGLKSSADRAMKSFSNFQPLDEEDAPSQVRGSMSTFKAQDCVACLKCWLEAEVARPLEQVLGLDIQVHNYKGY